MIKKVSIITVVKNGMPFLKNCIKSYQLQSYKNKELIVVYSESGDKTLDFLKKKKKEKIINKLIIDKKSTNKFESLNLALKSISGDAFGILHADDIFFSNKILSEIVLKFNQKKVDLIYGNVVFSSKKNILNFKRYWKSSNYSKNKMLLGWMPPHTSLFLSKKLSNYKYNSNYNISADYEYMINIFDNNPKIYYLNVPITIMRLGGDSTNFFCIFLKLLQDFKIIKKRHKNLTFLRLILKSLRKFHQLFLNTKCLKIDKKYINRIIN